MRRRIFQLVAVALALLTIGACSHSGGDGSASEGAGGSAVHADASAPALAPVRSGEKSPGGAALVLDARSAKIRTADLTVDVRGARNVTVKADTAADLAARVGGEVDSDQRTSGRHATATLRLRVPPAALRPVLAALSRLGVEVSRHATTQDVTERVADVESRVASARQAIARLRTLYSHATKVSNVIAIESELSSREADLESLEAQQAALGRETAMAAVTLYLRTAAPATRHHDSDNGFLGGLSRGWDRFIGAAGWVATAAGAVLPFLIVFGLLGAGLRVLWPRLRRHAPVPPPAPSPE